MRLIYKKIYIFCDDDNDIDITILFDDFYE